MEDKIMTNEELDEYFDYGGDITPFIVDGSIEFPGRVEASETPATDSDGTQHEHA